MATVVLRDADLRRLLSMAGELTELGSHIQPRPADVAQLLKPLAALVRCDSITWSRLDLTARRWIACATQPGETTSDDGLEPAFWAQFHQHPLYQSRRLPVATIGDVVDRKHLRRTGFYHEYMRPLGTEHAIKVDLSHPTDQTNVITLDRAAGRDFDDRDRLVMTLLRPHLDTAVRRLTCPAPQLTPRERQVLALVRQGLTNRAIARQLNVSTHTVRKHLENIFARLGVHSRTAAATFSEESISPARSPVQGGFLDRGASRRFARADLRPVRVGH